MNVFDSERIEESLIQHGISKADNEINSDLIILNTCHIREKAAEKVYSELGRYRKLKQKNPELKVGVIGCVAQAEGQEIIQRSEIVDMVLGPQVYHRLPEIIKKLEVNEKIVLVVCLSEHRKDSFESCKFIMDYLKKNAPFWKKEFYKNGSSWLENSSQY